MMNYRTKQNALLGFTLAAGVLAFALAPTIAGGLPWREDAGFGLHFVSFIIMFFGPFGIGVLGAFLAAVVGITIALLLPRRRTACPNCAGSRAIEADRSLITGRSLPNHCRDCGHTW